MSDLPERIWVEAPSYSRDADGNMKRDSLEYLRANTLPTLLAEAYIAGYEKFRSEEGGGGMWDEDLAEEAKEWAMNRIKGATK
jgi:hypothetical protein